MDTASVTVLPGIAAFITLDSPGTVDAADRLELITNLVARTGGNGTVEGDINLDGKVTGADYTLWAAGFGADTGWATGDINGDGASTGADYGDPVGGTTIVPGLPHSTAPTSPAWRPCGWRPISPRLMSRSAIP